MIPKINKFNKTLKMYLRASFYDCGKRKRLGKGKPVSLGTKTFSKPRLMTGLVSLVKILQPANLFKATLM